MNQNKESPRKPQEGLFTAISVGFTLLLLGTLFVTTPNLFGSIIDFFKDLGLVDVPNTDIIFIGPESLDLHMTVYTAVGQLSIAVALFEFVMLALRFVIPSSWAKRSETAGNLVYWTGAAFLVQAFLIDSQHWFVFWSAIIIVVGVSLIARAAVNAISRI
ncbi:MAG: hypothetical protein NWF06_03300 [Candidatus Bathyarchaeota archaeon]|nr:hypothetical protein [Candidatus Bathyarchaeum sp.]